VADPGEGPGGWGGRVKKRRNNCSKEKSQQDNTVKKTQNNPTN